MKKLCFGVFWVCLLLFSSFTITLSVVDLINTYEAEKRGNKIIKCELIQKDTKLQVIYNNKKYDLYDSTNLAQLRSVFISYDSLKRVCSIQDSLRRNNGLVQ